MGLVSAPTWRIEEEVHSNLFTLNDKPPDLRFCRKNIVRIVFRLEAPAYLSINE